jgi:Flp pilus assembly protein TadG
MRMLREFIVSRVASISTMTAIALPVVIGAVGLGVEGSSWLTTQRNLQNAADAAAVAAATNGGANYADEARAVAALYGFTDGVGNVVVTASNTAPCPTGGNTCYSVTVAEATPLFLAQVIGFTGTTLPDGSHVAGMAATAVAERTQVPRPYCILALATSGAEGIRTNGNPKADLARCNIMSNTSATCNGHDLNADIGDAHGINNGCGVIENSYMPVIPDPFSGLASAIPADPCSAYPQGPAKSGDPALPSSNVWSGTQNFSGTRTVCGDLQLSADVTVNALGNALVVIRNGRLDTNGHTLKTAAGTGLTVVFAGSNGAYVHAPTGGGRLDIAAPTTGPWKGVAIYQAPNLTTGVNISAAGNSPAWDITGLVYLPHATVTFSGAVNKASNGLSCFGLVVDNITINGTGSILDRGACPAAGLTLPTGYTPGRGKLVS